MPEKQLAIYRGEPSVFLPQVVGKPLTDTGSTDFTKTLVKWGETAAKKLQYALVELFDVVGSAVLVVPDLLEKFYKEIKNIFIDAKIEFSQYNVGQIQAAIEKYVRNQVTKNTKTIIEEAQGESRILNLKIAKKKVKLGGGLPDQKEAARKAIAELVQKQSDVLAKAKAKIEQLIPEKTPLKNILISNNPRYGTSIEDVEKFREEILTLVREKLIGPEDKLLSGALKTELKDAFDLISKSAVKGAALIEKLKADAIFAKKAATDKITSPG